MGGGAFSGEEDLTGSVFSIVFFFFDKPWLAGGDVVPLFFFLEEGLAAFGVLVVSLTLTGEETRIIFTGDVGGTFAAFAGEDGGSFVALAGEDGIVTGGGGVGVGAD